MNLTLLITGASRGIGAATAKMAARQGYAVAVNYHHNAEAANAIVAEIREHGGTAEAIKADVSTEAGVLHLFAEVDRLLPPLYGLVNNAGILETQTTVADIASERLQRIFTANAIAPFLCCREAIQRMSHGGAIVNVSSLAAKTGAPHEYADYAASKAALEALTIGLSKEVAAQNIRVNGVRPAFIYTDIHADGGEPGRVDRIKDSIPMQRGGRPEEVAEAILWLLSDKASYTTGTFIDLTGGK
ncbi:SDR family oxidoreductase [Mucilaginibacter lutimaris]|uniref:SDR family oxidoreductase n=1 Tax=Mucilaginibacter lutimaris TaxID=931629 RepID=A0ABW2ZDY2_9SPHI